MQDDHVKQQRIRENEKLYTEVFYAFKDLLKNFTTELTKPGKDKSGLRIYQDPNGIVPDLPKTGLRIFQAGAAREIAKTALAQVGDKAVGLGNQAKDAVLDRVDVAARNFVKDLERQRGQSLPIEQSFAEAIKPAPEPAKVKDRLLYADNSIKPEMQATDMLAVAELFTAQRGDRLAGDSAKNLVVEFNGQLLMRTDSEGKVQVNNLQNQEILANFDFREKNQIAETIAQFERLKPQLKQVIHHQEVADIPKLTLWMEETAQINKPKHESAEAQTPEVLEAKDPKAQETHQAIGSKRTGSDSLVTEKQSPEVVSPSVNRPVDRRLEDALTYMAGRDDGAVKIDGQGFNGKDSRPGNLLADKIKNGTPLTDKEAQDGLELLYKYRKTQLAPAGHQLPEWDEISHQYSSQTTQNPQPPVVEKQSPEATKKNDLGPIEDSDYKLIPLQATAPATEDPWGERPIPAAQKPLQNASVDAEAKELSALHNRLAAVATVAFNGNYKGQMPAQGKIQTPAGTIIHKTIIDQETKSFDIAIERDGQKHQVASYREGAWAIQAGMAIATPLIREISMQVNSYGEFTSPEVIPRREVEDQQQANDKQQDEPERDYDR
jgi:hypothetical protein